MPVSRTVNGLFAEITLDTPPGGFSCNFGGSQLTDTTTKKEGLASSKAYGTTPDPAVEGWGYVWIPNVAMDNGHLIRIWHKTTDAKHNWGVLVWGSFPYGEDSRRYERGALGWDDAIPRSDIHLGLITGRMNGVADWALYEYVVDWMWEGEGYLCDYTPALLLLVEGGADVPGSPPMGQNWADWFDHLVVCTSHDLTFTGLLPGQVVKMYQSPSTLLYTQTCAGSATSVTFDLSADDFPLNGYFKVYATDGITLIETTGVVRFSGGDTWYWVSPYGTMKAETDSFVIIRTAGSGTPKSATITATLLKPDTTPAVGKTLYFTTSKGSVAPASAVTDSNGQAQTVLTSDSHGIAVVKINWTGDVDAPACMTWAVHHILYDTEVADTTKKYQVFVEGVELDYDTGHYSLSTETAPQEFEVTLPAWDALILRRSLVSIYRWGVKEYSGILTGIERDMGTDKPVILSGVDSKMLLETRVITLKDYSDQPLATVLDDILDTYPCGIVLGTVGDYPSNMNITFADENIVSSVSRLTDQILGWLYRVTPDNTLDVMGAFGSSKPNIVFEQGVSMFNAKYRMNDSAISNSIRARGKETLVSTLFDPASIEDVGIIEDVAFQKSVDIQGTLDLFAQTELARLVGGTTEISCDIVDSAYAAGSWTVDDWVTLTAAEAALSGTYKVVKINRDMRDPNTATIQCSNRLTIELGDILDNLTRELKDLNAKSTI